MGQISANVQADAMAHVGSCDQHYTYSNESNYRTHVPQLHQPHFGWSPATSNQSTYTHIGTPQNGRSYASPQLMQNQYIKEEGTHMVAEYDRDPPNRPRNTKEELLCLLAQLTPAEVDNLKRLYSTRTGQRRRSSNPGMATRIASNDGVGAGSMPNDICDERKLTQSSCESTSTLSSSTTMDMSIDAYDSETDAVAKRGPKNERRASHNLIEKKYRCSINDCIQQLKIMITTDEVKMSKSATLRKAIEYINCLRTRNNELTAENERLRNLLKGYGVETSNSFSQLQSIIDGNSTGSPLSTSSQSTSESSDESSLSRTKQFRGMVDRSRVSIFVFMFMLLAFNPVSFFIASPSQSDSSVRQIIGGRTLKSINSPFEENENDSMWWNDSVIRPCFIWSINIFIVICFLIHLLVYGEPVADGKSSSWTKFLDIQAASERNINDGNLTAAASQLNECLQILERPLPCSGFDEFVSVVWQVIRHILNSIWIGRWFSRRRRSQAKPVAVVCRSYAYTALVYHQLNRLHLIGIDGMNDSLSGLYFALSAVNLSESAGCSRDGLPHAIRADIYIHAAFRVKMSMSSFLGKFLSFHFVFIDL
ncbi:hypothetical protein AB6A40_004148 [Gnathostoma spinigerum]|uniref:BHLH domain-containing protein n=1 Tax=Gnathostoma spinigerum TaxID=75299 RepID=A0ABD6EH11_9BILA